MFLLQYFLYGRDSAWPVSCVYDIKYDNADGIISMEAEALELSYPFEHNVEKRRRECWTD